MLQLPPLEIPAKKRVAPWYCETQGSGRAVVDGDCTVIAYIPRKVGSASGVTVNCIPPKIFPCDAVELQYDVFFDKGWDFKLGGKMLGVMLGDGASGGDWSQNGGSVRVVFQERGGCGPYLYIPLQVASRARMDSAQTKDYRQNVDHTPKGDHIWKDGPHHLEIGAWNTVTLAVRLNDPQSDDGSVTLTVNGVSKTLDVILRRKPNLKITSMCFSTFFGGSSPEAAAPKNAVARFRNVRLRHV